MITLPTVQQTVQKVDDHLLRGVWGCRSAGAEGRQGEEREGGREWGRREREGEKERKLFFQVIYATVFAD